MNPTSLSAGVFGGQVPASAVSVGMSDAGALQAGLASLKVASGPLAGKTVAEDVAMANTALGRGTVPRVSINNILNADVDAINNNFVDGTTNKG